MESRRKSLLLLCFPLWGIMKPFPYFSTQDFLKQDLEIDLDNLRFWSNTRRTQAHKPSDVPLPPAASGVYVLWEAPGWQSWTSRWWGCTGSSQHPQRWWRGFCLPAPARAACSTAHSSPWSAGPSACCPWRRSGAPRGGTPGPLLPWSPFQTRHSPPQGAPLMGTKAHSHCTLLSLQGCHFTLFCPWS